jgi:predicted membrane protein
MERLRFQYFVFAFVGVTMLLYNLTCYNSGTQDAAYTLDWLVVAACYELVIGIVFVCRICAAYRKLLVTKLASDVKITIGGYELEKTEFTPAHKHVTQIMQEIEDGIPSDL